MLPTPRFGRSFAEEVLLIIAAARQTPPFLSVPLTNKPEFSISVRGTERANGDSSVFGAAIAPVRSFLKADTETKFNSL